MNRSTLGPLRWTIVALLAIVLVAAGLRLVGISDVPPGLYHDEAVNGLDALAVISGERLPIFFEANGGREPLFIYLQSLAVWLLGPSIESLRLVSALVGLVTIPVFFLLARELTLPRFDPTSLALVAAAGFATSYWHLHWSRVGLRAILLPLLLCLALVFFMRARRLQSNGSALLAGMFVGLCMYSYLAARLVPLIFVGFFLLDWLIPAASGKPAAGGVPDTPHRNARLRLAALLFGAALLVMLPLGIYFVQTPAVFSGRTADIILTSSADSPLLSALLANTLQVAGMFFVQGDIEWRHGIALRPVLDPISASLFLLGLVVSIKFRRQASVWLAWLWLLVMLLPTLLSEQAPDTLRAIGAVPIIYWFVAAAWMQLTEWLQPRFGGRRELWTSLGVVLLLVGSGFFTANDYFNRWANDPRAYRDFDGEFTEIARWVNRQTENVYLPLQIYAYPTVQFLTLARARALETAAALASNPPPTSPGIIVRSGSGDPKNQYVLLRGGQAVLLDSTTLPTFPTDESVVGRYRELLNVARITGNPFPATSDPPTTVLRADFDGLRLVGYELDSLELARDKPVGLVLHWQRTGTVRHEPLVLIELVDAQGNVVARTQDALTHGISFTRFPTGQTIPERHLLPIETELAAGNYLLQVGLFDAVRGERWNGLRDGVETDTILLRSLYMPFPEVPIPDSAARTKARWQNGITLDAYAIETETLHAGASNELTLYWSTAQALPRDFTVFVHLLDENGKIAAQSDHEPVMGAWPTSLWQPQKVVPDTFTLDIPADAAPGDYSLHVGWYDRATNARVRILEPLTPDDSYTLGELAVRK